MNPPRPDDAPPTIVHQTADPQLAVIEFEPKRLTLRPIDIIRYALYSLVIIALAATSAYFVASRGQKVYGARSEILFERRTEQSTGFLREDRDLTTQLVKLRNRAILAPVASANGLGVDALAKKVHVSIVDSSEIIRIQVDDHSASRAERLVNDISKRYLAGAESPASAETQRFLQNGLAKIDRDIASRTARSERLNRGNPTLLAGSEQSRLDAEIKSLLDQRTEVSSRLQAATVDFINRPRVAQVTVPYRLDGPVSPKPVNSAAAGGLAGAVIAAIAVAVLARRRGQSVRNT